MRTTLALGMAVLLGIVSPRPAPAVAPTPAELAEVNRWSAARFDGAAWFFSFTCGGKPSSELLGGWELKRRPPAPEDRRSTWQGDNSAAFCLEWPHLARHSPATSKK